MLNVSIGRVLEDTRRFQHIAKCLSRNYLRESPFDFILTATEMRSVTLKVEDSAPPKLPTKHCLSAVSPQRLEDTETKSGIALATPRHPKTTLQSLPPILRIAPVSPIPSCSKASGVFSSSCRKAASSPPLYFPGASPRDSSPIVIPFVRV